MEPSTSRLLSSFQQNAPGSLTNSEPAVSPGCHIEKKPPWGSAHTAMRPAVITSMAGTTTVPPAAVRASLDASTSATVM